MTIEINPQTATRAVAPKGAAGFTVNDLPLSRAHVYNLIREGKLRARKVGRRTIITNWTEFLEAQPSLNKAA